MSSYIPPLDPSDSRWRALSKWEDEGGAVTSVTHDPRVDIPDMTNAEIVHLRVRIIALENLMIAVLAEGSDRQREMACDMADIISPRAGFTRHPLTLKAAHHMTDLVDRAVQFQTRRK